MYLITIFEKRIDDLNQSIYYNPSGYDEASIYEIFEDDINDFMMANKDVYQKGELIKNTFTTEEMVGVHIYKI